MPEWYHARMDYSAFDALTFDCYGTLIDWETGLLDALALEGEDPEAVLAAYAELESELEAGEYLPYREVLARAYDGLASRFGFTISPERRDAFAGSPGDWPAFADSKDALARLKSRFRLGVITNCDDDLFARSSAKLGDPFEWVVTAQQARGYKPNPANFEFAFARIDVPRHRILHVAQSLFHDHVPAKALGMTTVWIDRRGDREGSGATPPADAQPDARFPDMAGFAAAATQR
jgi:2-haloacid dehalogenase